ncbi:hypothetical protein [Variovorax sp. E3]|uniref:hypothetical protein n=1 Tax=Variovorax sp. E3 TaxID=1914993 RepID=UPI0018DBA08B|nr:hypothetical protein [Variovorax sp. E3]
MSKKNRVLFTRLTEEEHSKVSDDFFKFWRCKRGRVRARHTFKAATKAPQQRLFFPVSQRLGVLETT